MQLPVGYGVLPYEGGLLDQPYRMMEFFDIFFYTEREVAYQKLNA